MEGRFTYEPIYTLKLNSWSNYFIHFMSTTLTIGLKVILVA